MSQVSIVSVVRINETEKKIVHGADRNTEFQLSSLANFNVAHENQKADSHDKQTGYLQSFQHAHIDINVPSGSEHIPPQTFRIPGLHYHKIITLIKESFESPISAMFHLSPYKLF
jgi:hypothetical protein